jgi:hypothetical protein
MINHIFCSVNKKIPLSPSFPGRIVLVRKPFSVGHFGVRRLDAALAVWLFGFVQDGLRRRSAAKLQKDPKRCPTAALQNRQRIKEN